MNVGSVPFAPFRLIARGNLYVLRTFVYSATLYMFCTCVAARLFIFALFVIVAARMCKLQGYTVILEHALLRRNTLNRIPIILQDVELRNILQSSLFCWSVGRWWMMIGNQIGSINPNLPQPFFVTRLPKRVVTIPSLDFCCKASDSYDFGTGG